MFNALGNRASSLLAVTCLALAAAACANNTPPVTDWNFPNLPPADDTPRLSHAEKLANPPHPFTAYEDFNMEPTRFYFKPIPLDFGIPNADQANAPEEEGGGDEGF